jgi:hypothetical protein
LLGLIEKYLGQLLESLLKPVWDRVLGLSWWKRSFVLVALIAVIVPVYFRSQTKEALRWVPATVRVALSSGERPPLSSSDIARVTSSVERLAITLNPDFRNKGQEGYESWVTAQTMLALWGRLSTDDLNSVRQDVFEKQLNQACGCYFETTGESKRNVANSAWVMFAMAKMDMAAPDKLLDFLLSNRKNRGWWPVYPSSDAAGNASTYATA